MQRTEPPAISMVGTSSGTSRAERSIRWRCSPPRLSNALRDSARMRPSRPESSMALPANWLICWLLRSITSRPDSIKRIRTSSARALLVKVSKPTSANSVATHISTLVW
ncbi:hypothetical protein D3C77_508930 [compost metagenome]